MRTGVLALLLVVLPLQSVVQLAAGLQAHRHVHAGPAALQQEHYWLQPLSAWLDRLHAVPDARLRTAAVGRSGNVGPVTGLHAHAGAWHQHALYDAGVIPVSDAAGDALQAGDAGGHAAQGGATAFLAWLPATPLWPAAGRDAPPSVEAGPWRGRTVAPPRMPPRG